MGGSSLSHRDHYIIGYMNLFNHKLEAWGSLISKVQWATPSKQSQGTSWREPMLGGFLRLNAWNSFLTSKWRKFRFFEGNREKGEGFQLLGNEPRTSGLCIQCSATKLWQPDNHAPATKIYIYCSGGTKMLQPHSQQLLSMCFQNSIEIDRKILSIRRERMLSSTFVITWCLFPVNETPIQQVGGGGAKWKKSRQFLCLFSMFFRYLAKYIGSK